MSGKCRYIVLGCKRNCHEENHDSCASRYKKNCSKYAEIICRYCKRFYCGNHSLQCIQCDSDYCKKCFYYHNHSNSICKIKSTDMRLNELEEKMAEMHEMITMLMYAPNGPKYGEAKADFESHIEKNE